MKKTPFLIARNNKILLFKPAKDITDGIFKNLHYSFLIKKQNCSLIWYKGIIFGKFNNKGILLADKKWYKFPNVLTYFKSFQKFIKENEEYTQDAFLVKIEEVDKEEKEDDNKIGKEE